MEIFSKEFQERFFSQNFFKMKSCTGGNFYKRKFLHKKFLQKEIFSNGNFFKRKFIKGNL